MTKYATNNSSVVLSTWGTHQDGGSGMAHYLDTTFFGGNVGHASIEITIPADKEGQALIQKYCMNGGKKVIPFEKTTQNVLDERNIVKQQDVYKVYFSWWPGSKSGFNLSANLNEDNVHERSGVDVGEIDLRFIDPNDPNSLKPREQRTYHGVLGSKKVNLSNKEISHLTSLNQDQKYLLAMDRKFKECEDNIEAIKVLEKKLGGKDALRVEGTLLSLLNTHLPDWKESVQSSREFSIDEITKLKDRLVDKEAKLNDERQIYATKKEYAKAVVESGSQQALDEEITIIKEKLETLSPEDQLEMIQKRDEPFSSQAWINYELAEAKNGLETAQSVAVFCLIHNFTTQKEKILEILFDKKYPNTLKDRGNLEKWRQFLPAQYKNMTREEMTPEIFQILRNSAKAKKDELFEKQSALYGEKVLVDKTDPFFQGDHERFVTRGLSPDNQIVFPVSGIKESEHHKLGLNIEGMLKKMKTITEDGEKFNLTTKNCSVTTGAILAGGAEPTLRSYFLKKAWGGFGNPQEVYNGAMQYQHAITQNQGKKTFLEKLSKWNPLNVVSWLGGKMLNKITDPDTPIVGKIALGIGLIPMGALATGVETLKSFFNPKKTFTHCASFVNYAWNNNSIFLKLCSLPAAILAGVMVIPAVLQHGIQKAIVEPLSQTDQQRQDQLKEQNVPQQQSKLEKDKLIEIDEPDPEQAIEKLAAMLNDEPAKISILSTQTQSNLNAYINSLNKNIPDQRQKIEIYENTIKKIYAKVNEQSHPAKRFDNVLHQENQPPRLSLGAFDHFKDKQKEIHQEPNIEPSTQSPSQEVPQRPNVKDLPTETHSPRQR